MLKYYDIPRLVRVERSIGIVKVLNDSNLELNDLYKRVVNESGHLYLNSSDYSEDPGFLEALEFLKANSCISYSKSLAEVIVELTPDGKEWIQE